MQITPSNYFNLIKTIAFSPKTFFATLPEIEGYGKPTLFAAFNAALTMLVVVLFSLIFSLKPQQLFPALSGIVIVVPLMIIFLFIGAAVLHLIARILGGKGSFLKSYQVVAFTTAVSPATAIPFLGFLVSVYQIYITIVGFKIVHQYSGVKATVTVVLPIVVVGLVIGFLAALGLSFLGNLKGSGMDFNQLKNLQNIENPEDLKNLYPTFAPEDYPDYPTGFENYQDWE